MASIGFRSRSECLEMAHTVAKKAFKHPRWTTNMAETPQSAKEGAVGYASGRVRSAGDVFTITAASRDA